MEDYKKTFRIKAADVDSFLNLRSSTLLTFFQDISIEHTEEVGYRKDKSLEKGYLWVILKETIDIIRLPKYDEEITLSTYPNKMMHNLYPRSYYILDKDGNIIVSGSALWALIDVKNRNIVPSTISNINIPDMSNGRRFRLSFAKKTSSNDSMTFTKRALYSYCDLNGHLNNTKYVDICEDILPIDVFKNQKLTKIDIEYHHEIKLLDEFTFNYLKEGNSHYFYCDQFSLELKFE